MKTNDSARGGSPARCWFTVGTARTWAPGLALLFGAVAVATTSGDGRAAPDGNPMPPVKAQYRYAPTLAALMVGYEGVLNNDDKTNPQLVAAVKQALNDSPSVKKVVEKVHKAYTALPAADREKLVGKQLAGADGKTRLTKDLMRPIFAKHFKGTGLKAEDAPAKMTAEALKPLKLADDVRRSDPKVKVPDAKVNNRQRALGTQPKVDNSTRYEIKYTGLYCRTEPADWGHCEPYVIFNIAQGDRVWTRRYGPYADVEDGTARRDPHTLRTTSFGSGDVTVVATVFEHDLGNIDELEDAIHAALGANGDYFEPDSSGAVMWMDVLREAVADILTWFVALFGLDDDQIGAPQSITFTKRFAERHQGKETAHGIDFDRYLRFTGDPRGRASQRGDFFVYFDVEPE